MSKKKLDKVNVALQFNNVLISMDMLPGSQFAVDGKDDKMYLKNIQTVLAKGENAGRQRDESELFKVGDKVIIDLDRILAKQPSGKSVHIRQLLFDAATGNALTDDNEKQVKDENLVQTGLITDREILMVIKE